MKKIFCVLIILVLSFIPGCKKKPINEPPANDANYEYVLKDFTEDQGIYRNIDKRWYLAVPKGKRSIRKMKLFKERNENDYALIAGTNVNIRTRPDVNSEIITQLPVSQRVCVLHVTGEYSQIGKKLGRWVLISAHDYTKEPFGWIFEIFLATPDKFKKSSNVKINKIDGFNIGDVLIRYTIKENGRYQEYYYSKYSENEGESNSGNYISGQFYNYNKIYWPKDDSYNEKNSLIFFYRDHGKLVLENTWNLNSIHKQ